jgi:hypothetical protein
MSDFQCNYNAPVDGEGAWRDFANPKMGVAFYHILQPIVLPICHKPHVTGAERAEVQRGGGQSSLTSIGDPSKLRIIMVQHYNIT